MGVFHQLSPFPNCCSQLGWAGSVLPGKPVPQSLLLTGSGPPHGSPGFTAGHRGVSKEESLGLGLCLNRSVNKAPRGYRSCGQHRLTGGMAGDIDTLRIGVSY